MIEATIRYLALLAVCVTFSATASSSVQPFKAEYTGYFGGLPIGSASRELLKVSDNFYRLQSKASALGLGMSYSDISRFSIQDNQVILSSFEFSSRELLKKSYSTGRPNAKGQLQIDIDGTPYDFSSPDTARSVLNAATFSIQFQLDLKQRELLPMYYYAAADELKDDSFELVGEEILDSDIGKYQTLKILNRSSGTRETVIWVAPELDYQLLRAQINRNGKTWATLELKKLQFVDNAENGLSQHR
ncbi:DUF3108 domain-containing protein [Alginatibacterium sediminis]|uniref:DUF3108 domain-containing protein n=1 Tax=Alginatibacterium sediminis TaxID=2164068 RepID=A0A420EAS3_9ALTE|nr:DUF3108 domain-containing protein [Alginatibacterium sediminis]RKF17771.1 DUF3108 domain-containing protein [Alginatibacterium sediminis]